MTTEYLRIVQATTAIFEARDDADDRFFIFGTLTGGVLWFDVVSGFPMERRDAQGAESFSMR